MSRIRIFSFLSIVVFLIATLGATKVSAQLEQGVVKTIVGEFIGEDPGPDPDPGSGPEGFTFFCQYGKVDETGAMAPGGDSFWNKGGCDIYGAGCGPTSIAMIVSSFNKRYTPIEVSQAIRSTRYNAGIGCKDGGTFVEDYPNIRRWLDNHGFTMTDSFVRNNRIDLGDVRRYLNEGYYIAAGADVQHVERSGYTTDCFDCGHFFVITRIYTNNDLQVMDPTFCRLSFIGGRRKLTDVNNLNLRGRTNVYRWISAMAIKPKN